jgi:Holliday junction resolvase RusA-like endonuclease
MTRTNWNNGGGVTLSFSIAGPLVSNNRMYRHVGGRAIMSAEAREDLARVRSIAYATSRFQRWAIPKACAVFITVWNSRKDADNCPKVALDGMQGEAIANDSSVLELHVEKRRDDGGERYEIRVEAREPLATARALKAAAQRAAREYLR